MFKYKRLDGVVTDDVNYYADSPEGSREYDYYQKVVDAYRRFRLVNIQAEKDWVKQELMSTDHLVLPDATYKGESLAGTTKAIDITHYRKNLRNYDYVSDRPQRPDWYAG